MACLPCRVSGYRRYSIMSGQPAFFCGCKGDEANGKRYLLMGAVSGCTGCIREENSLRGLALMLFDEGDYERAYRHLNASIGNANSYGAWLLNIRASTLQPIILPCTM